MSRSISEAQTIKQKIQERIEDAISKQIRDARLEFGADILEIDLNFIDSHVYGKSPTSVFAGLDCKICIDGAVF